MLTYLRKSDHVRPRKWTDWKSIFSRPARFEKSDELPGDFTERRLNRRVFDYWRKKCDGEALPCLSKIEGSELGADWDNCFVIDAREQLDYANYVYLGANLAPFSNVYLSGKTEWMRTVLDKATDQVPLALESGQPVLCDDELKLFDGRRLLFRTVVLPLSEDGQAITHMLGAANGRVAEPA